MNKLIIVGNGFDRAHNLDTSYQHFLFWFLTNKENYGIKFDSEDPHRLIKYSGGFPIRPEFDTLPLLVNFLNSKAQSKEVEIKPQLDELLKRSLENWCDIESYYYYLLKKSVHDQGNHLGFVVHGNRIDDCNNFMAQITPALVKYLSDLVKSKTPTPIPAFTKIFEPVRRGKVIVLNFNYTNTVNLYTGGLGEQGLVLNIHGQLGDENSVIFGFGNEKDPMFEVLKDLNNDKLLHFIKSYKYLDSSNYKTLMAALTDAFDVHILGHSCGLSDGVLLKAIFEATNCRKIFPYFFKTKEDFVAKTFMISRHFHDMNLFRIRVADYSPTLRTPQFNDPPPH